MAEVMTFEQFQATGKAVADLAAALPDWQFEPGAHGRVYLDVLYIEGTDEKWPHPELGKWHLMLGNMDWQTDDLALLERKLYEFAISEDYISAPPAAERLTWFDLSKVASGTRVRFVEGWDIFPDCFVPAGTLGTVIENNLNEITSAMEVLPDDLDIRRALAEWDGQIELSPFTGGGVAHTDEQGNDLAWQELSPVATI